MTPEPSDPLQFLESLWPEVPEGMEILIWTLPDRRSLWCSTAAAAAVLVAQLAATKDVYTMVTLQPAGLGPSARGEAASAGALCGLWLDVDVAGSGHSTKAYPPDKDAAMEILYGDHLPAPTWLVATGGGYHAWWLFSEPWVLNTDAERNRAAALSEGWQALYRQRAGAKNYSVDSTHDLARVLRVPGSYNRKLKDNPRPVTIAASSDVRLEPRDFEELLAEVAAVSPQSPHSQAAPAPSPSGKVLEIDRDKVDTQDPGGLILNPKAEIKASELRYLMNRFPNFWPTWNQERQFRSGDRSASAYEMALANYGALAGWSQQKIVDLLIHQRRVVTHAGPKHFKYYVKTLAAAQAFAEREGGDLVAPDPAAPEGAATAANDSVPPPTAQPTTKSEAKAAAKRSKSPKAEDIEEIEWCRDQLSSELKVRILRLVQIGRDDPQYRLETDAGDVLFAGVEQLTSLSKFRNQFVIALKKAPGHYKDAEWPQFLNRLLRLAVQESIDEDAEIGGSTKVWLVAYLEDVDKHESWQEARMDKDNRANPHVEDGALHINCTNFCVWVRKNLNESITTKAMSGRLKLIGAQHIQRSIKRPNTVLNYWRLPPEDFDPQDYLPILDPLEEAISNPNDQDFSHIV